MRQNSTLAVALIAALVPVSASAEGIGATEKNGANAADASQHVEAVAPAASSEGAAGQATASALETVRPTPRPPLTIESTTGVVIADPPEIDQLAKMKEIYDTARKAFGGEHVLLTAMAYLGKTCDKHGFKSCGKVQGGAAGVVSLPLFGAGGGHGGDWYPVLQTKDASDAFARFQAEVKRYVELVDNSKVDLNSELVLRVLEGSVQALLDQVDDDDRASWEFARSAKTCLEGIAHPSFVHDDADASASLHTAIAHPEFKARLAVATDTEISSTTDGTIRRGLRDISSECVGLLESVLSGGVPAQIKALSKLLRSYWATIPEEQRVPSRHNFLIGPALGIPITESPTELVLLGGLAEVGATDYFRVAFTGGVQVRYDDIQHAPGWFAGLALSGALGDDLIHWINGGLRAARQLSALP